MEKKETIVKAYLDFLKKNKRSPFSRELKDYDVSREAIRHHFGSSTKLKEYMRVTYPESFANILDETLFEPQKFEQVKALVSKSDRFVITTALTGCEVHDGFFKALKSYCAKNSATLLILPSMDPAANVGWNFDSRLVKEIMVGNNLTLNKNIHIRMIQLSAKQVDPTTGLDRLSQKDGAFIYASPKQRLRFIPMGDEKLPHPIMTTGAITKSNYETERYMSKRTAYISDFDHTLGAIVVELDKDDKYYFRQIQAEPKTGRFIDLGKMYAPSGEVKKVAAEAFILGDYHAGQHDLTAKQAWKEVTEEVEVKNLIIHDIFNGLANNHHEVNKSVTRAKRAETNKISLSKELHVVKTELQDLSNWVKGKIVCVKSNHDEFLEEYLQDGRYIKDPINLRLASQLVAPFIDGKDPLEFAVRNLDTLEQVFMPLSDKQNRGDHSQQIPLTDRVIFLKRDESFKIAGVELGAHGDKGPNGSGGSMTAFEKSYGNCVIGHSHSPEILRGVFRTGTSTLLRMGYNTGASSWMHTSCLLYTNGSRQLINSIRGSWRKQ